MSKPDRTPTSKDKSARPAKAQSTSPVLDIAIKGAVVVLVLAFIVAFALPRLSAPSGSSASETQTATSASSERVRSTNAAIVSFVAVGEIGMDLYWDRTYEEQQREVLKRQMRWAEELDLPVCLHIRKAHNEVFGLLRDLNRPRWRGVMHCFGGSVQEARHAVEMGFLLGIGGVVTFKNATLADVVQAVPLESLLLETDAPYLSPVPHRGQRNEPAYVPLIAQRIADLRGITIDQVAETTTASARTLFRL